MTDTNDRASVQRRVDEVNWYHEFNFPNGVVARPKADGLEWHRRTWQFIQDRLDDVEFRDKTVLDLGCWDGYWSFYAERRGARRVLATDDRFQNWAGNAGLLLAKELLQSNVETRLDVSVYALDRLDETFDVIFFTGIYYHLIDPLYAFAQLRHCCHEGTVVIVEGDTSTALPPHHLWAQHADPSQSIFIPRPDDLASMLKTAYFDVTSQDSLIDRPLLSWREWGRRFRGAFRRSPTTLPHSLNRTISVCQPFIGENSNHHYPPPFGLHRYDPRFPTAH